MFYAFGNRPPPWHAGCGCDKGAIVIALISVATVVTTNFHKDGKGKSKHGGSNQLTGFKNALYLDMDGLVMFGFHRLLWFSWFLLEKPSPFYNHPCWDPGSASQQLAGDIWKHKTKRKPSFLDQILSRSRFGGWDPWKHKLKVGCIIMCHVYIFYYISYICVCLCVEFGFI